MTQAICPVCDATARIVAPYRHHHAAFAGMHRAECPSCGMSFATPMPTDAALEAYNASYFVSAHGGAATHPVAVAFHSGINRLRGAHLERYAAEQGVDIRSLLEIGPGGAYFARHWLTHHPGTSYHVVESDQSCHPALLATGARIHDAATAATTVPPVDAVVLSHVLEHVSDPRRFLRAVTTQLRPGGTLFIEVPCRDWEHKAEDEPHLLFFDKAPMGRLLEALGFRGVRLSYHGRRISELRGTSLRRNLVERIRNRLLVRGVVAPFARVTPGLEPVASPLERAAVRPYEAHLEQSAPSWWLRAVAVKS